MCKIFRHRWFAWLSATSMLLVVTNFLSVYYADDIKGVFRINNVLKDQDAGGDYMNASPGQKKAHVQVGVLLPDEFLFDKQEMDLALARSFLSEKFEWLPTEKGRLPKFIGLKGFGFSFKTIGYCREVALE